LPSGLAAGARTLRRQPPRRRPRRCGNVANIQVGATGGVTPFDGNSSGVDGGSIAIADFGDASGQRGEFHGLEEGDELRTILRFENEILELHVERHVGAQFDELTGNTRQFGIGDDVFAALDLLDLAGAGEQRFEIAELFQQLGCGLRADARNTGHVVGRIAGHRLQVDHLFRRHAPFLDDLGNADLLVLHRSYICTFGSDELHQVLVGGDDGDIVAAGFAGLAGIGGDDVVGLEAFHLDAGQVEGARRMADQAELRDQVFRRGRTVGLVERRRFRCGRFSTNSRK
jgi:hypothetical protein